MIPLLLVAVVALAAVVAAGASAASADDRPERSLLGGAGPPLLLLVGVVAVVLLGAAFVLVVGVGGGPEPDGEPASAARPPAAAPAEARPAPPRPPNQTPGSPGLPSGTGREVTITLGGSSGVIDQLPDSAVLVVNAEGFKPGTGEVAQCGPGTDGAEGCVNVFPVEFGAEGTARFQYHVSDRVHDGERCGAGQRPCLLVVFGAHDEGRGEALTVFHDPAPPPGRITAEPTADLADGEVVVITAAGFPPATLVHAAQCPARIDVIPGACRAERSTRTGPDGSVVIRFTVHTGESDGVACGWRHPCAIRVTADAPVAPTTLPVTFSGGPSVRYDTARLAGGLALAVLFLALARRLFRTADWREPAAAATPELDRSVLDA